MFYIFDEEWREKTIVSMIARQYMVLVKGAKFAREKVQQVADLGDRLVRQAGGYLEAARQLQNAILRKEIRWLKMSWMMHGLSLQ